MLQQARPRCCGGLHGGEAFSGFSLSFSKEGRACCSRPAPLLRLVLHGGEAPRGFSLSARSENGDQNADDHCDHDQAADEFDELIPEGFFDPDLVNLTNFVVNISNFFASFFGHLIPFL